MTYSSDYYQRHRDPVLEAQKRYYQKNREEKLTKQKEYNEKIKATSMITNERIESENVQRKRKLRSKPKT